ncbi:MAG: Na+/glucose cotransporter, partial [Candidatus Marinimicrobia bacterium]|nr:Na+/glucose cotransporter [Candidatus Neomarinimicrobiota bacterium]
YFQYYSLLITVVCVIVMIVVSRLTQEPSYEKITGLTYSTTTDEHRRENRASWSRGDVIASVALVLLIVLTYIYFSG